MLSSLLGSLKILEIFKRNAEHTLSNLPFIGMAD